MTPRPDLALPRAPRRAPAWPLLAGWSLLAALPLIPAWLAVQDLRADLLGVRAGRQQRALDLRPALATLQQAARLTPGDPQRHLSVANAAATLWQLQDQPADRGLADTEYDAASALSPQGTDALSRHALMYRFHGDAQRALPYATRAAQLDVNNAGLLIELARTQQAAGQQTRARASYARCLTLDDLPECQPASP